MFASFFKSREWALWAWPGAIIIILGTWYQVQVDVAINEWFGSFYGYVLTEFYEVFLFLWGLQMHVEQ